MVEAVTTAGRSVILAGSTVVIAVLGLMLTGLPYMYGVAIAASLAVLVVMLAAVTLLPALLSYLGPRVDRLRLPLLGRRKAKVQVGGESLGVALEPRGPAPAVARGDRRDARSCSRWPRPRSACASASPTPATTRRAR